MRILTVADVPPDPNSGAAGTVYHTNVALRELGHEVDEIWADDLGPRRISHGNLHSLLEQPRAYRREVLKAVNKKGYDVVIMSQPQAYLAARALRESGFAGRVINRSHGVELRVNEVLTEWHKRLGVPASRFGSLTRYLQKLLQKQWAAVVKWCDGIIVGNETDRRYLLDAFHLEPERVRAIGHGVSSEFLISSVQPMTPARLKRLLYVGQHAFVKGPHLLTEMVNRVLTQQNDVQMTWVTSRSAHEWIRSRLSDHVILRVTFLDWQDTEHLLKVYDEHGLFIFPSFFEGFGKAPFEAMARGLEVFASDEGGMKDYIQHGQNSWLFPVGDVNTATKLILQRLANTIKLERGSDSPHQTARNLSWTAHATKVQAFLEQLMDNKKAGGE